MAPIKFQRIVSCSSQDPAYPAENLLKFSTTRRWKSSGGQISASVIIQLEKSCKIWGIDIGNESSAFVEVFVGRECVPDVYEVILPMASFMTPMDTKEQKHTNRVRLFSEEALVQPVRNQSWDRIKVNCTQPFDKSLKFGLAFISLHGSVPHITVPKEIGRFTITNNNDDISIGSIFARHKVEPKPDPLPPSAARSWRDAVKASSSEKGKEKAKAAKKNESQDSEEKKKKKRTKSVSPPPKPHPPKRRNVDEPCTSKKQKESKQVKLNPPNVTYKVFNKLLEDVEFAISGYVNPARADIRTKALEMGAKYRPDWTPTCTHLICAFGNTPKFQQVKGKGIIVYRNWIDDCYTERKKLPWQRYSLDKADVASGSKSDEKEVWELVEETAEGSCPVGRRNALSMEDTRIGSRANECSSSDTEDEIERVRPQIKMEAGKDRANAATPSEKAKTEDEKPKTEESEDFLFIASTDEESGDESDKGNSKKNDLPKLPSIFNNKHFYAHPSLSTDQRERVERYILALGGNVCKILDENVRYVIAERNCDKGEDEALFDVLFVTPDWIWQCNDARRLVPFGNYQF